MLKETLLKFFKLEGLVDNLTGYIETRLELVKHELKEDIARAMAKVAIVGVIVIFFALFILFLSVTAAYLLAEAVGVYGGFGIVAGVYLLLVLILIFFREPIGQRIEQEIKKSFRQKKDQDGNG
ncbi:MAG: phage holin family protein [Cyclobacteriaceae bacterium]|nr:phage holin family protein [Cyclobacteriaceae bacterium]